jgi:hypothetical protein
VTGEDLDAVFGARTLTIDPVSETQTMDHDAVQTRAANALGRDCGRRCPGILGTMDDRGRRLLEGEELIDQVFEAQGQRHEHSATKGRSQTPAEMVLRLLLLKHVRN